MMCDKKIDASLNHLSASRNPLFERKTHSQVRQSFEMEENEQFKSYVKKSLRLYTIIADLIIRCDASPVSRSSRDSHVMLYDCLGKHKQAFVLSFPQPAALLKVFHLLTPVVRQINIRA